MAGGWAKLRFRAFWTTSSLYSEISPLPLINTGPDVQQPRGETMSGLPNSGTPSRRRHSHARGLGRRCGLRSRSLWPPQHPRYAAVRGAVGSQATREGGQAANRPRNVARERPHAPMPITYTNRTDVTYTLYRATTATGRARDAFARQPSEPSSCTPHCIPSSIPSTALYI